MVVTDGSEIHLIHIRALDKYLTHVRTLLINARLLNNCPVSKIVFTPYAPVLCLRLPSYSPDSTV